MSQSDNGKMIEIQNNELQQKYNELEKKYNDLDQKYSYKNILYKGLLEIRNKLTKDIQNKEKKYNVLN